MNEKLKFKDWCPSCVHVQHYPMFECQGCAFPQIHLQPTRYQKELKRESKPDNDFPQSLAEAFGCE